MFECFEPNYDILAPLSNTNQGSKFKQSKYPKENIIYAVRLHTDEHLSCIEL